MPSKSTVTIIHFEDGGQDFSRFEVAPDGQIVNAVPFQAAIWTKYKVSNLPQIIADFEKEGYAELQKAGEKPLTIMYRIENVTTQEEALNRECIMHTPTLVFTPKSIRNIKCPKCGAWPAKFSVKPANYSK